MDKRKLKRNHSNEGRDTEGIGSSAASSEQRRDTLDAAFCRRFGVDGARCLMTRTGSSGIGGGTMVLSFSLPLLSVSVSAFEGPQWAFREVNIRRVKLSSRSNSFCPCSSSVEPLSFLRYAFNVRHTCSVDISRLPNSLFPLLRLRWERKSSDDRRTLLDRWLLRFAGDAFEFAGEGVRRSLERRELEREEWRLECEGGVEGERLPFLLEGPSDNFESLRTNGGE